jgi:hypothetical protein
MTIVLGRLKLSGGSLVNLTESVLKRDFKVFAFVLLIIRRCLENICEITVGIWELVPVGGLSTSNSLLRSGAQIFGDEVGSTTLR